MMKSALRPVVRAYRASKFKWRYVDNLRPTLAYRIGGHPVAGETARVLHDLNRHGIAITSADALLGSASLFPDLLRESERLGKTQAREIDEARRDADIPAKNKTFIYELLGERPALDPSSIFVRFALQPSILSIANGFYGMYAHLRFYNVWHTFTTKSEARRSQLWHRDPEDWQILKVFVYLSDVDEGAGPFTYAPGTHPKGAIKRTPDTFKESGHSNERATDEQMSAVVPQDRWISAVGKAGTIIFADTKGFHRGGLARERDRIMYNCLFVSPASRAKECFTRNGLVATSLGREAALALNV